MTEVTVLQMNFEMSLKRIWQLSDCVLGGVTCRVLIFSSAGMYVFEIYKNLRISGKSKMRKLF